MDCSLPGSSIHGIFQARVLEWGAIAFTAANYSLLELGDWYMEVHYTVLSTFVNARNPHSKRKIEKEK